MGNFFSGHNMANDIMKQTSLPLIMQEYQKDYNLGVERHLEHHPERLDVDYETTKPFLAVPLPSKVIPSMGMILDDTEKYIPPHMEKLVQQIEFESREREKTRKYDNLSSGEVMAILNKAREEQESDLRNIEIKRKEKSDKLFLDFLKSQKKQY